MCRVSHSVTCKGPMRSLLLAFWTVYLGHTILMSRGSPDRL